MKNNNLQDVLLVTDYYGGFDESESFESFIKRKGKKGGGALNRLKDKIKQGIDKAGDKLKDLGQAAKLAPLLPFKGAMKKMLSKKKVSFQDNIENIAETFYKTFIKKKNFEDDQEDVIDIALIAAIVPAVVAFFKMLGDRKAAGEKLSAEEAEGLKEAEKAADAVVKAANEAAEQATRDAEKNANLGGGGGGGLGGMDTQTILILAAVAVAFIFVMKK